MSLNSISISNFFETILMNNHYELKEIVEQVSPTPPLVFRLGVDDPPDDTNNRHSIGRPPHDVNKHVPKLSLNHQGCQLGRVLFSNHLFYHTTVL